MLKDFDNSASSPEYAESFYIQSTHPTTVRMAYQTFLQEYLQIPIVTRVYTSTCVITTLAVVRISIVHGFVDCLC